MEDVALTEVQPFESPLSVLFSREELTIPRDCICKRCHIVACFRNPKHIEGKAEIGFFGSCICLGCEHDMLCFPLHLKKEDVPEYINRLSSVNFQRLTITVYKTAKEIEEGTPGTKVFFALLDAVKARRAELSRLRKGGLA